MLSQTLNAKIADKILRKAFPLHTVIWLSQWSDTNSEETQPSMNTHKLLLPCHCR